MLSKLSLAVACAALATLLSQPSFARGKTNAGTATVTGCLVQGDEANEYMVRSADGKTYGLKGSNLAQHMNHKVTVTGTVTEKKAKTSSNGKPEEDYHMKVSEVKMVSSTCQ